MDWLTPAWSGAAAVSLLLGLMDLSLWATERSRRELLAFGIAALAGSAVAVAELTLQTTTDVAVYRSTDGIMVIPLGIMLVAYVWFIQCHFGTGRRWLATLISILWALTEGLNLLSPQSVTFLAVTDLERVPTFFGAEFTAPVGELNSWRVVADLASLLIVAFLLDASVRLWRKGGAPTAKSSGYTPTVSTSCPTSKAK